MRKTTPADEPSVTKIVPQSHCHAICSVMTIFERAKTRADAIAPPPPDRPIAAAATAFGFGLLVIGMFMALAWFGLPSWIAGLGSACIYGTIAYADCALGWSRNANECREALKDLKDETRTQSLH